MWIEYPVICIQLEPASISQKHYALETIASHVHSALYSRVAWLLLGFGTGFPVALWVGHLNDTNLKPPMTLQQKDSVAVAIDAYDICKQNYFFHVEKSGVALGGLNI